MGYDLNSAIIYGVQIENEFAQGDEGFLVSPGVADNSLIEEAYKKHGLTLYENTDREYDYTSGIFIGATIEGEMDFSVQPAELKKLRTDFRAKFTKEAKKEIKAAIRKAATTARDEMRYDADDPKERIPAIKLSRQQYFITANKF